MKKHLLSYAEYLKIQPKNFYDIGILNPVINSDIRLFIDPRLLKKSKYEIFSKNAVNTYDTFYKNLANDIRAYLKISDEAIKEKARKTIINKLTAKEPAGLGLGYSKVGTNGQGVGKYNAKILFNNALDIYKCVPDIGEKAFSLLNILSEGIGADYIGDITANIILKELASFTENIAKKLNIPTKKFKIKEKEFKLPIHPKSKQHKNYILFVPQDILSDLPTDASMENVFEGYIDRNEIIRTGVNEKISDILKQDYLKKNRKQSLLFDIFKDDAELINSLAQYMVKLDGNKYDFNVDSKGFTLRDRLQEYLNHSDLTIRNDDDLKIIKYIIEKFEKFVSNNNKLKRELLWKNESEHKPETAWQQIFHTYIDAILFSNNLDVISERETQSGPVDFCFSKGSKLRVLIELKLSTNSPIKGLVKQLEKYKECTDNVKTSYFICINVHKKKSNQKIFDELVREKNRLNLDTNIIIIDGHINPSASNL